MMQHGEKAVSDLEWGEVLPPHWDVRRLKHICEVFPSNVDKKTHEGDTPVLLCNYTDVYYNDRITGELRFMEATATAEQIQRFSLVAGDTIITKDSETPDDIAIAAYVPEDLPGVVCGYHLSMVRPRKLTSGAFVKWLFGSRSMKASVQVRANGLTRVGLGQYAVDNLVVPVPPYAEQVTIAAFLDRETSKIDALVEEQRRLIELLNEKRQAAISHAVTKGFDPNARMKSSGVDWLGDVPSHWEVLACRHLLTRIEQGWSPECENRQADVDEWGVLKAGCANGAVFRESENKALPDTLAPLPELEVQVGDVVMSRANGSPENVGATAYVRSVRPKLMLSDKTFRLHPSRRVRPEFLALLLGSPPLRYQIERSISGAAGLANNLPQSALRAFVGVAPPLEEQDAIVKRIQAVTEGLGMLALEAERAVALLLERRSALISAAVTGKIDVRGRDRHEVAA